MLLGSTWHIVVTKVAENHGQASERHKTAFGGLLGGTLEFDQSTPGTYSALVDT